MKALFFKKSNRFVSVALLKLPCQAVLMHWKAKTASEADGLCSDDTGCPKNTGKMSPQRKEKVTSALRRNEAKTEVRTSMHGAVLCSAALPCLCLL